MEREEAARLVNNAISREHNSLSEYVLHSSPWTTPADDAALKVFQEIRDAQAATAQWLTTRLREEFSAGPTLRAFEHWKRDLNYLSVPYLVRFAHEHYGKVVAEYDDLLKRLAGDPVLTPIFTRLRDEAKAHRDKLTKHVPTWTEQPREAPPA